MSCSAFTKKDKVLIGRIILLVKIIDNKNEKKIIIKYKLNKLKEINAASLLVFVKYPLTSTTP